MVLRQGGDPALGETFRSPSKFTRGLNPTPSFSPKAETLALPWWSHSQGTRSHVTPRRARCYPVSARYSRVAVLCLPMRVPDVSPVHIPALQYVLGLREDSATRDHVVSILLQP